MSESLIKLTWFNRDTSSDKPLLKKKTLSGHKARYNKIAYPSQVQIGIAK